MASLKSGRYKIAVDDETSKSAFKVQRLKKQPVTVTGRAFVGKHTVTVTLDAGQWWFFSGAGKKKTYFVVVTLARLALTLAARLSYLIGR